MDLNEMGLVPDVSQKEIDRMLAEFRKERALHNRTLPREMILEKMISKLGQWDHYKGAVYLKRLYS